MNEVSLNHTEQATLVSIFQKLGMNNTGRIQIHYLANKPHRIEPIHGVYKIK